MQVLAYTGGAGVELQVRPDLGDPPDGWARIRVTRAGICATDLELVRGYKGFSGVLGHEFCGVVEASPSDLAWEGRRVVGEINIACGT
ncbi:MAG TPA: alcohol dehydrogenase catalytic domain-containing protein, partial [Chloroflexia bacterium]|nr:alcohol dehydrogenase catalytic domain-containing protein [Chloroflexia bacterium]